MLDMPFSSQHAVEFIFLYLKFGRISVIQEIINVFSLFFHGIKKVNIKFILLFIKQITLVGYKAEFFFLKMLIREREGIFLRKRERGGGRTRIAVRNCLLCLINLPLIN